MTYFTAPKNQPRYARDTKGQRTTEIVGGYLRPRLDENDRAKRTEARRQIVAAANRASDRNRYTARQLQLCVAICRRLRLVSGDTLARAGFNPEKAAA